MNDVTITFLFFLSNTLPYIVKYLIGYCHFYYQLGYGLIFYIYFYRRHRAKKLNNWRSFYGNSITNWLLFNASVFNKYIFSRTYFIFFKASVTQAFTTIKFWLNNITISNISLRKFLLILKSFNTNYILYNWTPLFKRTSYISFSTFLKRFTKRK